MPTFTRLLEPAAVAHHLTPIDSATVREVRVEGSSAEPRRGHRFEADAGPFEVWERQVVPQPGGGAEETIRFRLAAPYWRVLFHRLVQRELRRNTRLERLGRTWWGPPVRLSPRDTTVLSLVASVNVLCGYLGSLMTRVLAFAAHDLGVDSAAAQTDAQSMVRIGVVVAIAAAAAADRLGRRVTLLWCLGLSVGTSAFGVLCPDLRALTLTQFAARNLATGAVLIGSIIVAEELPASCRAYAVGLTSMAWALGAGVLTIVLPVSDLTAGGWRIPFGLSVLGLVVVSGVHRRLPESVRFERSAATRSAGGAVTDEPQVRGARLALFGGCALLTSLFVAPASQLQNTYLVSERGYRAAEVTAFILGTGTLGGLGVIAGGRLGDERGRRWVGALGMVGVAAGAAIFATSGAVMWLVGIGSTIVGALSVSSLGVYGPEMFPTRRRGLANGLLTALGVVGSVVGLRIGGRMVDAMGYGRAFGVLALAPLAVAVAVVLWFPETAGRDIDELS